MRHNTQKIQEIEAALEKLQHQVEELKQQNLSKHLMDTLTRGQIYKDVETSRLYLLAAIDNHSYSLINLGTANRYTKPLGLKDLAKYMNSQGCFQLVGNI